MDVPYVDLAAAYRKRQKELDDAVGRVLASGSYVLGENKTAFEEEFGRWLGVGGVTAVNSGTDALYLAMKALGIGRGDEVITTSHTAINTVLAISKTGAEPVLVDIDPETYCMMPGLVAGKVTPRTKAIIPVHIYGHPVDMEPLAEIAKDHELAVIEDCAQAHGAEYRGRKVGTIGDCGCFSFYPTKNLGGCGDGGAVATDDEDLAARVRSLANCGQGGERYVNILKGDVSRMDELKAAFLRVMLKHLDGRNERRRQNAAFYNEALTKAGLELPQEQSWGRHVYHLYVVRSGLRDRLQEYLAREGVQALVHYPVPVHRQPAYAELAGIDLPMTEQIVKEILSLPVHPDMEATQLDKTVETILRFAEGN